MSAMDDIIRWPLRPELDTLSATELRAIIEWLLLLRTLECYPYSAKTPIVTGEQVDQLLSRTLLAPELAPNLKPVPPPYNEFGLNATRRVVALAPACIRPYLESGLWFAEQALATKLENDERDRVTGVYSTGTSSYPDACYG